MSVNNFTYSKTGLCLTEGCEGCRCEAYQDVAGVWTIGYGHTGPDVHAGLSITEQQAEALLAQDVSSTAAFVNRSVTVPLTQEEFDGLVDFVFNIGTGAFQKSTMLADLNAGNFAGAAAQFQLWDRAGGKVVAALLQRRNMEARLFQATESVRAETTDSVSA
jgi:lysozyme